MEPTSTKSDDAPADLRAQSETGKRLALQAPLTEGSLWRAIWIMSWPLMLTTIAGSAVGMADVQVAGYLGSSTQAAVGLSEHVLFLFMVFVMSVSVGTTAIVSRAFGAKHTEEAIHASAQSLALAVIMGITLSIAAMLVAHLILPLFCTSQEVIDLGRLYLGIYGLYLIPSSIIWIVNASFRAIGNARTPLAIVIAISIVNVVGDYLTVRYNWPVPGLGIKGIALSALVANGVGAVVALIFLSRSALCDAFSNILPLDLTAMKRVLKVGVPSAFQRLSWAATVFALFFLLRLCPSPTQALASWTIGMRVEATLFMPLMALSLAVSSITGQNLGAKRIKRAFKAGWHVTWIGVWLMLVLSTLLFSFAEPLARVMSHDPKTIEYTTGYLRINAFSEPILAINMILAGALQGAGDTRMPMWISIFSNWTIRLPLAWLVCLAMAMGPNGIWLAMVASTIVSAALVVWRYQSRAWISVRV